ncbi:acyltransferase family protein [Pseudomonas urmiensis]|uniref:Acyltransferase n=1 Tax=Pseudomonas urmiensis TaxID=2745493 RepID=A0A923FYP2_9PSED|nr:acyltransferase [Pseudomonas urmiensis]MBV4537359.1 acyltransferase [Pseudomonas urmiensis]
MDTRVLTGLRFLAAAIVVVFHFGSNVGLVDSVGKGFLTAGPQMVGFFFVLSGFIMAYVYLERPRFHVGEYFIARFARIVPVYMLALLVLLCFRSFGVWQLIVDVTLLKAWFPQFAGWGNYPGWSISVELFFYALFPLALFLMREVKASAFSFSVFAILVWAFSQLVLANLFYSDFYKVGGKLSHALIFYFPISHLASFIVGLATAFLLIAYKADLASRRAVLLAFFGVLASACAIYFALNFRVSSLLGFKILNAAGGLAPLYAFFIFAIVVSSRLFSWLLANRISVILGEASYALYILQLPVFLAFKALFSEWYVRAGDSAFYLYFLFLVFLSIVVFVFVERPFRDMVNNSYRKLALKRKELYVV